MTVKTVGLDLAKDVFQVHCVSATGRKIINKKIKRAKLLAFFETLPRCVVGMEACGSAHHWGRELRKLGVNISEHPDGFTITGPTRLQAAEVDSYGDHRLGMALAVAGLAADGPVLIQDAGCIHDSFPGFVETMQALGANMAWSS